MDGSSEMLPMNGGKGENSYAKNSLLQVLSLTWEVTKEAITELCYDIIFSQNKKINLLTMADLGCSSGPNAFFVVSNFIKEVEQIRQKLHHNNSLEYQFFLNDLPGNDFNSIFQEIPTFLQQHLKKNNNNNNHVIKTETETETAPVAMFGPGPGSCLLAGVPGSFYGRLFPQESIHFFHSSYSLQLLSRVPKGVENNNKGSILMSSTSPKSVVECYYKQFQKDFSMFLIHRGKEMIKGGRMVLTMIGRTTEDRFSKECCYHWEILYLALNQMVVEGSVEEEKLDSFNIPAYMPSISELKAEVLKEGSFGINRFKVSFIDWNCFSTCTTDQDQDQSEFMNNNDEEESWIEEIVDSAYYMTKCMRAAAEPLVIRHFGADIDIDELFSKYKEIIDERMSKEKNLGFINLTVSLTKI